MKRRAFTELGALLRLGLPMMATQLFIMATGFLDTVMAGRYSAEDLGGVALGGNVMWPAFMLLTGITMAVTPIVSQMRGAAEIHNTGAVIRQGLWLTLVTSTLIVIVMWQAEELLQATNVDQRVIPIATGYLKAAAFGIPPVVVYVALRHACEGLGQTRPPMFIAGSVLPLNAALNYVFIYGHFGFPELGGVGCGWATAIVFWIELILMGFVLRKSFFRDTGLFDRFDKPNFREITTILKLGIPIGLTIFLEMAVFSVVGFMIARLGVAELAAHSIAGNINWLTYVIPASLGAAASIRVGFHVGANNLPLAKVTATSALRFTLVYALIVSLLLIWWRHNLVGVYTNDLEVLGIAATLLIFIALYQIVDDTQAVMIGVLRGYKDTQVPMLYSLIGYWVVALPLGYALAQGNMGAILGLQADAPELLSWLHKPLGVYGYWGSMSFGLMLVAIAVTARVFRTANNPQRIAQFAHR